MCLMKKCCCWRDSKSPCIAVAILAMVTSMLQILVQVTVYTAELNTTQMSLDDPPYQSFYWKLGIAIKLYIALAAADVVVILLSFIFLIGLERPSHCRYAAVPWIVWILIYILYESAINITFFSQAFTDSYGSQFLADWIIVLVYWVVKDTILFFGWLFVVSRECCSDYPKDVNSYSSSLHLVPEGSHNNYVTSASGSFGPILYARGGATQVEVHDNPRSYGSHFDVVRPASVFCPNAGRIGGCGGGGVYGPQRLIYTPN